MTYSRKVSCIEEENMSSKHYVKTEEALGRLTEQQRHVTQDEGTEPAVSNQQSHGTEFTPVL